MIDLEKLFSGRESNSALEVVQTILFNGDKVKEKTVTGGIRITEDVQLLEKAQVLLLIIVFQLIYRKRYFVFGQVKKSTLFECQGIHIARKYKSGTLFLRFQLETGPPFFVVIRATRRFSCLQCKGSTFISQSGPGNRTRDLPLCSQVIYRLS